MGQGVLPSSLLVHIGVPVTYEEPQSDPATWIEGEPGPQGGGEPTQGPSFSCVLFLPSPGGDQQNPYRPKTLQQPTLLLNPTRDAGMTSPDVSIPSVVPDGSPVLLAKEQEVLVYAPELEMWTGAQLARWLVVGQAQPFGKPGYVYGLMFTLRQVLD